MERDKEEIPVPEWEKKLTEMRCSKTSSYECDVEDCISFIRDEFKLFGKDIKEMVEGYDLSAGGTCIIIDKELEKRGIK